MVIKPSLGRTVWFTPGAASEMPTESDGRCAAIVVKVWHDRMVNLTVFDAEGHHHAKPSVALVQEGDAKPGGYFCEWMPYQREAAAKALAAEKAG